MEFGVILDVETTGLDPSKDSIIEIGLLEFGLIPDQEPVITRMYGALEDPGCLLPPEIEKLTGIKTPFLQGQKINWVFVRQMLENASIIIAHNMKFDRDFIMARPDFSDLATHWGCSCRDIDWDQKGYKSAKLNYLAADHGFVNSFAHRALFDCATTFRLISKHLLELTENSYTKKVRIDAVNSPFEKKDFLKERGYRWDGVRRVWTKTVRETLLPEERIFLANEIYLGPSFHREYAEES